MKSDHNYSKTKKIIATITPAPTGLAPLRVKGVQAYGIGPRFDEAEFAAHGWHGDVERLSEDSLYGLVQFLWYAVLDVAASK